MSVFGNKRLAETYVLIVLGCVAAVCSQVITEDATDHSIPCPDGWTENDVDVPYTCVLVSNYTVDSVLGAHNKCLGLDASQIVIQSQRKFRFYRNLVRQELHSWEAVWIGLHSNGTHWVWLTKDGDVMPRWAPAGMSLDDFQNVTDDSHLDYHYDDSRESNFVFEYDQVKDTNHHRNGYFVCEKKRACQDGWFGADCNKHCRCLAQECDPTAMEVNCVHGCFLGWMGQDCTQRKQDAVVRYFCVDSSLEGTHLYVRLDTLGMNYQSIEPLNENGQSVPWCHSDVTKTGDVITMKVYVDPYTVQAMADGSCPGKIIEDRRYEWNIRIQELSGFVSKYDQEVHIECDFKTADNMQTSAKTSIKRERNFRRSDIQRHVNFVTEQREQVTLQVGSSASGNAQTSVKIGSSVVLRFTFGTEEGNVATGVRPYSCNVTNPTRTVSKMFIDQHGCPLAGFPISGFHRESPTSLTTDPFPLFGFMGTTRVVFLCAYTLCFDRDGCRPPRCDSPESTTHGYHYTTTTTTTTTRHSWYPALSTPNPHYPHNNTSTTTQSWRGRKRRSVEEEGAQLAPIGTQHHEEEEEGEEELSVEGSVILI